jgi:hypothetical protein
VVASTNTPNSVMGSSPTWAQQPGGILLQRRPVPDPVRGDVQDHHAGRQPDARPAHERDQYHDHRIKDDEADEEHLDPDLREGGVRVYPTASQVPDMRASALREASQIYRQDPSRPLRQIGPGSSQTGGHARSI